jgi:hypothetical protein
MTEEMVDFLRALFPAWMVEVTVLMAGGVAFVAYVGKPLLPIITRFWKFILAHEAREPIRFFYRYIISATACGLPVAIFFSIENYRWILFSLKWEPNLAFLRFLELYLLGFIVGLSIGWIPAILSKDERKPLNIFFGSTLIGLAGTIGSIAYVFAVRLIDSD